MFVPQINSYKTNSNGCWHNSNEPSLTYDAVKNLVYRMVRFRLESGLNSLVWVSWLVLIYFIFISAIQIFLDLKFFGPKIFLDPKSYWTQNYFGPKIILDPKSFLETCCITKLFLTCELFWPYIFWDPYFFWTDYLTYLPDMMLLNSYMNNWY